MSIAPVNFYSSFALVPVFQWEPVEPVEPTPDAAADTQPAPVVIESDGLDSQPEPPQDADTPASTQLRLVFKGFEWVFTPGIATFPRPDWMDGITAGCTEEADDDRMQRVDEAEHGRKAGLHAPRQPDVSGSEDAGPAATDTSDTPDTE
jgi:hypothetical protein